MELGLSIEKFNKIPEKTKQEIVEAVREGMTQVSVFSNGIAIIYGESHMPHRKRGWRRDDIEMESHRIARITGADYYEIYERFMQEMRDTRFISNV